MILSILFNNKYCFNVNYSLLKEYLMDFTKLYSHFIVNNLDIKIMDFSLAILIERKIIRRHIVCMYLQ